MAAINARHTTGAGLIAALATLAAALAGCTDATSSGEASTRGSDDLTSASGTTSTEELTQTPPTGIQKIGEIPEGDLFPGRYALQPVGPLSEPLAVVDVPDGYRSWGSFIEADEPVEPGDPLMLGLWDITGVYMNPCTKSNEEDWTMVTSIADALARQRLTSATEPREVTLDGGYHALYMEVTTPTDLDYSQCDEGELNLWDASPDGGYWTTMPGMVQRLWILDVDAHPMVIHMAVPPSATGPQIHAMTDIVEAATFKTPDA